ncbi:MAG: hypothetical protein IKD99_08080 [Erysipelotrichaceae bacterium]|nr:hypothetical protein [Erysipelotrichaceae bacterium]
MKISEMIRKDRQKLSEMTGLSSKIRFLWDYYKAPIIAITLVLTIGLISVLNNIGRANVNLYVVLLNNDTIIRECDESIFNDTMSRRGIDMKKKTVNVNTELSVGIGSDEAADMETMQVLTALFSISDLDVYVAPREYFDYFAANNGFADLNVLMDKNLLAEYSADLYKYDETTANRPVQGIVLHKGSPLHKAGYYHGDVIIGVVKNAVHFDEAVTFLQQLLRDRN